MILCVQARVGEAAGHCPSNLAGEGGLQDRPVPTGAWNGGEKRRETLRVPCGQPRRKKGSDLSHSEDREDLIWMDNCSKIELSGAFLSKLIFNFFSFKAYTISYSGESFFLLLVLAISIITE